MERVGIEAGATSIWLCHELLARNWPVICIETRHAKAALAAQSVKTDRNDARGIAHIMRTGWFRAVRKYASGETDFDGRITKCGDPFVRSHLFEAAKVLLARAGKKNALKAWGLRVARRSSKKNACVAVARRLAVIMHAMWRDGTVFQLGETEMENEGAVA
jgi:transposase